MIQKAERERDMKKRWYPVITIIGIDVGFAISNILIKEIIGGESESEMNHLVFITYRQLVSTLFLAPLAYFYERNRRPKLTSTILIHLFFSAIVGASLTQYFFLLGIQYTSATFSCAFLNMVPVITFLMALPFGMETVKLNKSSGRAKLIGTVVCLGGTILLIVYKGMPLIVITTTTTTATSSHSPNNMDARRQLLSSSSSLVVISKLSKEMRWTFGSLALLGGTLLWSSWFVLQPSIGKRYPDCQFSSTAIMAFFSFIQSLLLCFTLYNTHGRHFSIWLLNSNIQFLTIIYTGMIGSGLCYVGMSWCVKKEGPVFTAAFSPFIQVLAALYEVPFSHEQLYLGSVLGSVVVILGLYILLWGKNKERQNSCQQQQQEEANATVKLQENILIPIPIPEKKQEAAPAPAPAPPVEFLVIQAGRPTF